MSTETPRDEPTERTSCEMGTKTTNYSNLTTSEQQGGGFLSLLQNHELHRHDEHLYVRLSTTGYLLLALITCVGLLVSLISNMIIIYLFTRTPSLRRNPSNIIAVNLSLSDLLYCTQWPSVIYCSLTQSTKILEYDFVCQSFGFITVSTAMASVLTVLAMSVERAIVISYSIYAKRRFTIRGAWLIIVLIWAVAIASSLPPLFGKFNRYTLDPSKTSCTLDYLSEKWNHKLYILFVYAVYWITPTVIICISYASIIMTFKKSSLSLREMECSSAGDAASLCKSRSTFASRLSRGLRDSTRLKAVKNGLSASISNLAAIVSQPQQSEQVVGGSGGRKSRPSAENARRELIHREASNNASSYSSTAEPSPRLDSCLVEEVGESEVDGYEARRAVAKVGAEDQVNAAGNNTNRRHTSESIRLPTSFHENLVDAIKRGTSGSVRSKYQSRSASFKKSANNNLTRAVVQFRLAKMSFYLILLWLVSWTPIASLALLNAILESHQTSATAVFIANTMTKLGPAFDVFIYGISHPKIKSKFKQIFKWLFMFGNVPDLPTSRSDIGKITSISRSDTTGGLSLRSLRNPVKVFFKREDHCKDQAGGLT